MGRQEDNDSEWEQNETRLSSLSDKGRENAPERVVVGGGGNTFKCLFFLQCCCICVCVHKSCHCVFVIMSLRRACHSQYVRAACTFALLRSSLEVAL